MNEGSHMQRCQPEDEGSGVNKSQGPGESFTREVVAAWSARVGVAALAAPADKVQTLFNDLHLYPTKTQVFEMLVCARQCARRSGPLTLSFGEFCVFASELRRTAHKRSISSKGEQPPRPVPSPELARKHADCDNPEITLRERLTPPHDLDHSPEVFLGGSCNPTTWRGDIAIPMLEKMGITYFNPQVADWSFELIEIEHQAKQQAKILLFVLDAETRATAASVEAAYLAASGRDILLVLKPYRRGQTIAGEPITDLEYLELSRARSTLQEAAEKRGLPVFTDVAGAVRCARALLRRGPRNGNTQYAYLEPLDSNARPAVAGRIIKLKKAFDSADEAKCGSLTVRETAKALENFIVGLSIEHSKLVNLIKTYTCIRLGEDRKNGQQNGFNVDSSEKVVNFELFCSIIAEVTTEMSCTNEINTPSNSTPIYSNAHTVSEPAYNEENDGTSLPENVENAVTEGNFKTRRKLSQDRPKNGSNGRSGAGRKLSIFIPELTVSANSSFDSSNNTGTPGVLTPHTSRRLDELPSMLRSAEQETKFTKDVYLGGSSADRTTWREKNAIPFLRQHNLTYCVPKMNDYSRMFSAPPLTPLGPKFTFDGVANSQAQADTCTATPVRRNLRSSGALSRTSSLQSPSELENCLTNSYSTPSVPEARFKAKRSEDDYQLTYLRQRSGSDGILRRQNSQQDGRSFKHERSPTYEDDHPEKRPKISPEGTIIKATSDPELEGVEIRNKIVGNVVHGSEVNNRLSASDFYRVSDNASPLPFKGMYDERELWSSRALLFAITGDTRCMAPMALAAHHMGLRPNDIVLCVQLIENSDGLSDNAIKDYNRGRLYLIDLAKREGIPVFDKLEDALHCLVNKLKDGS